MLPDALPPEPSILDGEGEEAVEECPLCELSAAVSCPACNGTGSLRFGAREASDS